MACLNPKLWLAHNKGMEVRAEGETEGPGIETGSTQLGHLHPCQFVVSYQHRGRRNVEGHPPAPQAPLRRRQDGTQRLLASNAGSLLVPTEKIGGRVTSEVDASWDKSQMCSNLHQSDSSGRSPSESDRFSSLHRVSQNAWDEELAKINSSRRANSPRRLLVPQILGRSDTGEAPTKACPPLSAAASQMGGKSTPRGEELFHRVRDAEDAAKKAVAQALSDAKAVMLAQRLNGDAEASMHKALESLLDRTDRAITELCEEEFNTTKAKLRTQANWHAAKLDTSRVAAATRMEHKIVEAKADFQAHFDAKLRALASANGSSIENELMERIEELNAELKRLRCVDELLSETRAQLDATEAELSTASRSLASLTEEVHICTKVMERAMKKDLDAELRSAEQGTVRDQLLEVIDAYKQAGGQAVEQAAALRAERDDLRAKVEEAEAATGAVEAEMANVRAELNQCRSAEAEYQLRVEEAERETTTMQESLRVAAEEIEVLREAAEEQRKVAEAAEAATERMRGEAEAAMERAKAEAEARVAEVMEQMQSRVAEMTVALAEANERASMAAKEAAAQKVGKEAAEAEATAEAQAAAEAHQRAETAEAKAAAAVAATAEAQAGKEEAERRLAVELAEAEEAARLAAESGEKRSAEVAAGADVVTTLHGQLAEASRIENDLRAQLADLRTQLAEQPAEFAEQPTQANAPCGGGGAVALPLGAQAEVAHR